MPAPDSKHAPAADASVCSRCLFENHCFRIRMLGLPCGQELAAHLAGCRGILTVLHGALAVESAGQHRVLREGESWTLPENEPYRLRTNDITDVVLFETLNAA